MSESPSYWRAESLGTVERWDIPVIRDELDLPPPPPPHTADHLDELERTAYEDGYARGHSEGYAAGDAQGYADGAARVREQTAHLKALLDHLAKPMRDLDGEVERTLIALALEVGRRLAQATLIQEPEAIAGVVREALGALGAPARDARIHLHPKDVELVGETLTLPADFSGWRLVPDRDLMRGDVRIVTDSAQVDARLDTREASVAQALLGELS